MKKILVLTYFFVLIQGQLEAQSTFQKVFGGSAMDDGNSVRKTNDDGFFIVGTTTSFGSGGRDILAIRTNYAGDTTWTRTYGGDVDNEYGFCGQQTNDGGYIISGVASSFNDVAGDMYLIKLNAAGDTSWTRTYGGIGYEWGSFVQQTTDGGYIVVGQTPAYGAGGFDAYLLKLNATGDISWTKTYGDFGLEIGFCVQQTSDGGYILTGQIDSYGAGSSDFLLLKTDVSGNTIWKKAYGTSNEEAAVTVRQTIDGGYILGGSALGTSTQTQDMCLLKTNAMGDLLWSKTYGGGQIDEGYQVTQTTDGGYILCGKSFSFSTSGDYDVYVVKTNNLGNPVWSRTYGSSGSGSANDIGYSIQQTIDGGYVIVGETYGFGVGFKNVYLIKTDASGNSGCNQGVPGTISDAFVPQVNDAPIATNSGGVISYPATIVNSGTIKTLLCENIPLPATAIQLRAQTFGTNQVELSWHSTSNVESYGFEVHKSEDGILFETMKFLLSQSSTNIQAYAAKDLLQKSGTFYYRIKQVNNDGSSQLSPIVSVRFAENSEIKMYPNPTSDFVTFEGIGLYRRIQIIDATGRIAFEADTENQSTLKLATSSWRRGLYLVRYLSDSAFINSKLVID